MIILRKEQFDKLHNVRFRQFKRIVQDFIEEFYPVKAAFMGKKGTINFINLCIEEAAGYSLSSEKDYFYFIHLKCEIGNNFMRDFPWITEYTALNGKLSSESLEEIYFQVEYYIETEQGIPMHL